MAITAYLSSKAYLGHLTGSLPERPERLVAIADRLRGDALLDRVVSVEPVAAEEPWLEAVHDQHYVDRFRRACEESRSVLDSMDNPISRKSEEVARLAAGGAVRLVDTLAGGDARYAFAALRPPGHHAGRDRAMGFCFYNNVAVAVRRAQEEHGVDRVLVFDFDVHHGNGTQEIFWEDPSVFYASLHQFPLYPGTGAANETGAGEGEGTTLNLPLDPGGGDAEYREAFEEVKAAAAEFRPEFIVLSAGFDAHEQDPLAAMRVTDDGFAEVTRRVVDLAGSLDAPVLSLLEGGYDLDALGRSVARHLAVFLDA
jgi:acetoin utilization deacetylase AcuC-like enzyme